MRFTQAHSSMASRPSTLFRRLSGRSGSNRSTMTARQTESCDSGSTPTRSCWRRRTRLREWRRDGHLTPCQPVRSMWTFCPSLTCGGRARTPASRSHMRLDSRSVVDPLSWTPVSTEPGQLHHRVSHEFNRDEPRRGSAYSKKVKHDEHRAAITPIGVHEHLRPASASCRR